MGSKGKKSARAKATASRNGGAPRPAARERQMKTKEYDELLRPCTASWSPFRSG